jgi:ATP-binding cassette subfamily B protein
MVAYFIEMGDEMQGIFAGMNVAFRTGPLFVLPAGLLLYANGSLDLPTLLLFLLISLGFARPIYNLLMHGSMAFYQMDTALKRINGLLSEPSLPEPVHPQRPQDYTIKFDRVGFSYDASPDKTDDKTGAENQDSVRVLDDVSFTIPQGSVTALVGPSGAGKTTISRLIPRFWDVDTGSIEIGGVDIRQMNTHDLMDTISFVFQDVFLFNDTIYENIRVGNPDATRKQIIAAAKLARCHDFIEELGGYEYNVGENGARLSGGERQRISVARAILKNAPIIVLDEATAFVDPENEALIQEALAALMASNPESPKTLVVVAHRLSTITQVDQVLLVDGGRILASGTHTELLASNELYQTLWESHTDASKWQFDTNLDVETLTVNRNTAYDGEYAPLHNPFEPLKTAQGHWQRINALVADDQSLFRRAVL